MPGENPPVEELRAAVERLTTEDLIRLRLVARLFDPRRHEDLLQEAISRTLSGERKWRDGIPLYWHLHQAIRSIAWDWDKKLDENLVLESQLGQNDSNEGFLAEAEATTPDPERQAAARLTLERMPRAKAGNFHERERDALVIATTSNDDIIRLCRGLGDDPRELAERVRHLLLNPVCSAPSAVGPANTSAPALPLPDPGMLPLCRILLVDDDAARLAEHLEEFRLHQFRLRFVVETSTNGQDALARLQNERFEAVLIELRSPTEENRQMIEELRNWSTPLAPILLNSAGMEFLELRTLNRTIIRRSRWVLESRHRDLTESKGLGARG